MIKKITFLLIFFFTLTRMQAQYSWALGEGSTGMDIANAITLDNQGNVFICGNVGDFGQFNGVLYNGRGLSDAFVAKYNSSGQVQWVKLAGSDNIDKATALTTDVQGNVFVVGLYRDTAFFESTALITNGQQDVFIAKYSATGNLLWAKSAGGTGEDQAQSITIDGSGNIYISGFFTQSANFSGQNISSSNPFQESFMAKYDNSGNLVWAKASKSLQVTSANGIAFSKQGKILLTGCYSGRLIFGNDTVFSSSPNYEIFLAQFDLDGNIQWLKSAGGAYEDVATAVACDPSGNAFITGYSAGSANFDTFSTTNRGYNDAFVAKYDGNGKCLWAKSAGDSSLDYGNGIATDNSGNVFICGQYKSRIVLDNIVLNGPDRNIFFASYDGNGNIRWAKDAGESGSDCALGIAVSSDNKVYVIGYYLYRCIFGKILLPIAEAEDLFVAKYDPTAVGVDDLELENSFQLSSNIVQNRLGINLLNMEFMGATLSIKNIMGQEVWVQKMESEKTLVELSFLPAGIYFAVAMKGSRFATRKFLKE